LHWVRCASELGKWVTGSTPKSKNSEYFDGDFPFVTPSDIREYGKILEVGRTISDKGADSVRRLSAPSVLLVCIGTIGKVGYAEREVATNQQINALQPNTQVVLPILAMYLLAAPAIQAKLWEHSTSTTVALLNKGALQRIPIVLPPLAEQERIVEILEEQFARLDSALASVKAVREKAQAFRRSLLHSAFSGELTGGTEGWREVAKWSSGGTPQSKNPKFYGGDISWCVIGDLTEGLVYETAQHITPEGLKASSAKIVDVGTVMVAMYGASIGRVGVTAKPMATNQAIGCAAVDESQITRWYLLHYLASQKRAFNEAGQGAAQPNISQTLLKAWNAPLPPLATQERIVELLEEQFSRLDKALEVANQLEAGIASERRSLLHSAFTGALTATWRQNND
jgi:restriction endonuclease S subunit